MTLVYCYYCRKDKDSDSFTKSSVHMRHGTPKGRCKECTALRNKEYRKNNKEKLKVYERSRRSNPERLEYDRQRYYQRKYGITRDEYNKMREDQAYRCKICGTHESVHKARWCGHLHVDHCHSTGNIRGLLCKPCNTALGGFRDNIRYLETAIKYLKEEVQ